MTSLQFSSLRLKPALQQAISGIGYETMTPIQALSIEPILAGKDILAQAETGSGKTAAFGIGVLSQLNLERQSTQGLVICPTRELSAQVAKQIRRLGSQMSNLKVVVLCGGVPASEQLKSLQFSPHIIVGTPGRIEDLLQRKALNLRSISCLVLDEADRMLDMGFAESLENIFAMLPLKRQTLLFSATFPEGIKNIARDLLNEPVEIQVKSNPTARQIEEIFLAVENSKRSDALYELLKTQMPESTIVFCTTKIQCKEVANDLNKRGIKALEIHGDLLQAERDETMILFGNKSHSVLVATDVAARGLDVDRLELVVNFEMAKLAKTHVHRIGRTGRAGAKGLAITFFSERDTQRIKDVEDLTSTKVKKRALREFIATSKAAEPQSTTKTPGKMTTLCLNAGKKNKIRPGDILGAFTVGAKIPSSEIGKIDISDSCSYVAIGNKSLSLAMNFLGSGKVKGKTIKARIMA